MCVYVCVCVCVFVCVFVCVCLYFKNLIINIIYSRLLICYVIFAKTDVGLFSRLCILTIK